MVEIKSSSYKKDDFEKFKKWLNENEYEIFLEDIVDIKDCLTYDEIVVKLKENKPVFNLFKCIEQLYINTRFVEDKEKKVVDLGKERCV